MYSHLVNKSACLFFGVGSGGGGGGLIVVEMWINKPIRLFDDNIRHSEKNP